MVQSVCHCFHCFPIYLPWSDGNGCHGFSFLNVGFKLTFSLSPFTFIKRLFSSSWVSSIREVSSAHLRLLILLLAFLIPACASSSSEFWIIYSAYKLNKQVDWQYTTLMYPFPYLEPVFFFFFLTCIYLLWWWFPKVIS